MVKSIKNGEISDIAPMGKKLRLSEVAVIDATNGFGLDFVKEAQGRFRSTTLNIQGRTDLSLKMSVVMHPDLK